ncbi:tetratricopeptide repeat protein [Marinobacter mobilis]|uniref:Tetratricopeptide repeat-containing protein n=1 Tax=Marinobacter mobilis TaxID=488533 RepID=A0A1H2XF37_9GAMM|nr:tetratricopeptide repeat protein [Marinobacter mobilis]SDW91074.1 Tetratricopeptide repeat-containing protein [Marinobacter mobilis]
MTKANYITCGLLAGALVLGGCATSNGTSIYVPSAPAPGFDPPPARVEPEPAPAPQTSPSRPAVSPAEREPTPSPSYRDEGETLSGAAASLIRQADSLLAQGNVPAAIGQLERAQRISPRSPEVYFKLSEAYVAANNLGAAEQFTLKGLSLAGSNVRMQRTGWLLLADIRRARGNVAGANQAEARASSL